MYPYLTFLIQILSLIVAKEKEVDADFFKLEESPGTKGQGCRLTAGQGDLKDSVTENKPPFSYSLRPFVSPGAMEKTKRKG